MRIDGRRRFAFGAALLVAGGIAAGPARAADEGIEEAVSVAISLGGEINNTVRAGSGASANGGGMMAGLTGLLSVGAGAGGVSVESSPSVDGIGNRTVGGLAGVRLPVAPYHRLLVLGEAGLRTFYDKDDFLFESTVTPGELWLPYVGARVGLTWLISPHLDVGAIAFARKDIGEGTMVVRGTDLLGDPTARTHQVGGFAGGVAVQFGFRFDATRPLTTPVPVPPARTN